MIILEKNIPLTEALFYILLAVRKPNHGYGITQEVEELTDNRVTLGPGTLYGAIQSLVKRAGFKFTVRIPNPERKRSI